jgi:hypothetical protein
MRPPRPESSANGPEQIVGAEGLLQGLHAVADAAGVVQPMLDQHRAAEVPHQLSLLPRPPAGRSHRRTERRDSTSVSSLRSFRVQIADGIEDACIGDPERAVALWMRLKDGLFRAGRS